MPRIARLVSVAVFALSPVLGGCYVDAGPPPPPAYYAPAGPRYAPAPPARGYYNWHTYEHHDRYR